MWKLLKRYSNGKNKMIVLTRVEVYSKVRIDYYAALFYPKCKDGSEKEINVKLIDKKWISFGRATINKTPRAMIGRCNLTNSKLVATILYVDAYWKTCDFWTQGDPEEDIPLTVGHFLFLVDKLAEVLGAEMFLLPEGSDEATIVNFLEQNKFKISNRRGQW